MIKSNINNTVHTNVVKSIPHIDLEFLHWYFLGPQHFEDSVALSPGLSGVRDVIAGIVAYEQTQDSIKPTGRGTSVGSVSASYVIDPKIDTRVRHILSWLYFPSSPTQEE